MSTGEIWRVIAIYNLYHKHKDIYKTLDFLREIKEDPDEYPWCYRYLENRVIKIETYKEKYDKRKFEDIDIENKINELAKSDLLRNFINNTLLEYVDEIERNTDIRGLIIEGRDCGKVFERVLDVKVFLDSNMDTRINRMLLRNPRLSKTQAKFHVSDRDRSDVQALYLSFDHLRIDTGTLNLDNCVKRVKEKLDSLHLSETY